MLFVSNRSVEGSIEISLYLHSHSTHKNSTIQEQNSSTVEQQMKIISTMELELSEINDETKTVRIIKGDENNSIPDRAFLVNSSLGSVHIEDGANITTIGEYAFWRCLSLKSITIPNTVTTIGEHAFGWCSSLRSIDIPNSVKTIV